MGLFVAILTGAGNTIGGILGLVTGFVELPADILGILERVIAFLSGQNPFGGLF